MIGPGVVAAAAGDKCCGRTPSSWDGLIRLEMLGRFCGSDRETEYGGAPALALAHTGAAGPAWDALAPSRPA